MAVETAAYLLCLKSDGGIPIFSRTKGCIQQLSYPVIGSLNGIHTFCSTSSASLQSATTDHARIVWKIYNNSITLILVSHDGDTGDWLFSQLLDLIFNSMVFMFGFDEIASVSNVDRLKKDIKVCFALVDSILDFLQPHSISLITLATELITGPETVLLQTHLDGFAEAASSSYGCLLINGRVAVATKKWWEMTAVELVLLQRFVNVQPKCNSQEVVIFLPDTSPKVPYRLLIFNLMPGVKLCVICGPAPSLSDVERKVDLFWQMAVDSFKILLNMKMESLPSTVLLDHNIMGFILVNIKTNRCLLCVDINKELHTGNDCSELEQIRILFSFYRTVVGSLLSSPASGNLTSNIEAIEDPTAICNAVDRHLVNDMYICTENNKCYAFQDALHQFYLLYSNSLPSYAMRSVSHKTLQGLLKQKWIPL